MFCGTLGACQIVKRSAKSFQLIAENFAIPILCSWSPRGWHPVVKGVIQVGTAHVRQVALPRLLNLLSEIRICVLLNSFH